jgi:hypothetical protein
MEKKPSATMEGAGQAEDTTSVISDRSAAGDAAERSTTASEKKLLRKIDRWCVVQVLFHFLRLISLAFYP